MSRLPNAALLILVAVGLSSCTGPNPDGEPAAAESGFDDIRTPSAGSSLTSGPANPSDAPSSTGANQPSPTGGGSTTAAAGPADGPGIEIVPNDATPQEAEPPRKSLVGAWEFVVCDFGIDLIGMLIDIEHDGDTIAATIEDSTSAMPGWTIQSAEITEKTVQIAFGRQDGGVVDFQGELHEDGIVRGNVAYGRDGLDLVRWLPSQRDSLEGIDPRINSERMQEMIGFQPSSEESALAEYRGKARELGRSSLAYELYHRLNAILFRGQRPQEDQYSGLAEELVGAARQWGLRVETRARLEIAHTMAVCGYSLDEARTHLNRAREQLGESLSPAQQQRLSIAGGLVEVRSDNEAEQQSGAESLTQVRAEDPYNTSVTLGLADYYDRSDQQEEALDLYAELAALPTGEGEMDPVTRLWKELGRDPAEVEDYLNQIYKSRTLRFAEEKSDAPRATGTQRIVLGELFTGAGCPPCVAADVATGGLEVTYPTTDFIMLRYHEHVPAPDPLATPDSERRGVEYYRIHESGTPALFVDGQKLDPQSVTGIAGPFFLSPMGYANLRQIVDSLLAREAEISISLAASADADAETIALNAAVTGVDTFPESWRLRLCLAEDEIMYPASNGIRQHRMVVRAMPGGPDGIAPENGKLAYDDSISLTQIREEIRDYLSQIPGLSPPKSDMANLNVVAFVQDDSSREILQATIIPVSGP